MDNIDDDGRDWALEILRQSLRASRFTLLPGDVSTASGRQIPTDPDKLQYLRELIFHILNGRTIVSYYNVVLLAVLGVLTLLHAYRIFRERRRWRAIEENATVPRSLRKLPEDGENDSASSSSSTFEGSSISQSSLKPADSDVERQPLLGNGTRSRRTRAKTSPVAALQSWLMYQPRPIPLINRTLPSNGTSLFVCTFLGLNVFLHLYQLPLEARFFFAFADRAGLVFIVNLPILYLLAAKNQPLKLLTGHSYEALNIYHRRVGELMCLEASVHFASMLVWRFCLSPDWLVAFDARHYFLEPVIYLGIGAWASYELLYFTSLGSFRERFYEVFLASHVFLQVAALAFLWLHFFTSRPYICASLVIFLLDRIVWRLGVKSAYLHADLTVLEDGMTLMLSTDWDIPRSERRGGCFNMLRQNIVHGWHPADHVFVSIPNLGRGHSLQAHPFTISSAAPDMTSPDSPKHAWLNLLIRVQSGFTYSLLQHACLNATVPVRLEGPYGSSDPLNMLRASENAVLVAGGSGIAVVFPMAWDLAFVHRGRRAVHLLWVIHSRPQRHWVPMERLNELREAGVHVTIPEPTQEVGRPDISAYVSDLAATSQGEIGMVVSGPDGLNRSVRNACATMVKSGANINLRVEKFGW
ncbi:hypothetical protein F4775DRAFT_532183 [Biscogniauxia sp. FL1348]|nr:hypothetical protein F4775DRAFT_532183 [Biscogniauxia sp. FL1348]